MKYVIISFLTLLTNILVSQTTVRLSFVPTYGHKLLVLNDTLNDGGIQIETLKFYISRIEFYQENTKVFIEENSFHLLDAEDVGSLRVDISVPDHISFSHIKFNVGIDSLTNVSGAFGGDLDPTNGMYWTWQSGYINFKLEGKAKNCPARHNHFQFHIGGYQAPFNSLQIVELEIQDHENIHIDLEINKIFDQVNLKETYQLMSPGEKSVAFSKLIPSIFSISK
ncbi:MAG: MbnP family protein [Bacteroidia bacterium]